MSIQSDFLDWKANPVTKQVFASLKFREQELLDVLGTVAGTDPLEDRFKSGYIAALRDIYLIRLDEEGVQL